MALTLYMEQWTQADLVLGAPYNRQDVLKSDAYHPGSSYVIVMPWWFPHRNGTANVIAVKPLI